MVIYPPNAQTAVLVFTLVRVVFRAGALHF